MAIFDIAIAMIFAREFLEANIIIGQYRTLIAKSLITEIEKAKAYRTVWLAAGAAAAVAVFINIVLAVVLAILGNKLDNTAAEVIEGVSKIVASICIGQLSLKIPTWLGIYYSKKACDYASITRSTLCFDVAWNIWREIAEIGVFLIPSFLQGDLSAVPLSALVGIAVAFSLGGMIYIISNKLISSKYALAVFMAGLTGLLSVGLFTGGCHEFEEVLGETPDVYELEGDFFSHKKFPGAMAKPFGYSQSPTVLQITCFWIFAALILSAHALKYWLTRKEAGLEEIRGQDACDKAPIGVQSADDAVSAPTAV